MSALGIKVPAVLKRTLTSMQIAQFVFGFAFAVVYLFVGYDQPVQSPYMYYHNLSTALPSATAMVARAVATADVGSWIKKAILRAAGDEGLSSNIRNRDGYLFGHSGEQAVLAESDLLNHSKEEIRYRQEYVPTDCIDTSGQAFAIYLNLLYLLPLTMLFLRFFVKSYLKRPARGEGESQARRWSKSGYDAAKSVEKELVKAMRRDRGSALTSPAHSDAEASSSNGSSFKQKNKLSMTKIKDQASGTAEDLVNKGVNGVKNLSKQAKESDVAAQVKNAANKVVDTVNETAKNLQNKAGNVANKAAGNAADSVKKTTADVQKKAGNAADSAKDAKNNLPAKAEPIIKETADTAKKVGKDLKNKAEDTANKTAESAKQTTKDLKNKAENTADSVKESKDQVKAKAESAGKDVESDMKQASEDSITDGKDDSEGTAGEAVKSPSKKKRKHKHKNKEHSPSLSGSQHDLEHPESYAEAAAQPPTSGANDVIPVHGKKVVVGDEEEGSTEAPDAMAQSYETSIDEITTEEQKEAEREMQPDGLYKS